MCTLFFRRVDLRDHVIGRHRQPGPGQRRGDRRGAAVIPFLRKERNVENFGTDGQRAARLQQGHGLRPGAAAEQNQANDRRRNTSEIITAAAHRLPSDEGKNVGEAQNIRDEQYQEDNDHRADQRTDNILTGRKRIDTPGQLADFDIR